MPSLWNLFPCNLNFLLIGLAGSGKSTLVNNLLKKEVANVNDTVQSCGSSVRKRCLDSVEWNSGTVE